LQLENNKDIRYVYNVIEKTSLDIFWGLAPFLGVATFGCLPFSGFIRSQKLLTLLWGILTFGGSLLWELYGNPLKFSSRSHHNSKAKIPEFLPSFMSLSRL